MKAKHKMPVRIAVYFGDNNKEIYNRLENIADRTGMKLSRVASMCLRFGVAQLEERLLEPSQLEPKKKK